MKAETERVDVIPGLTYTLRMPCSEAMMHMGLHGNLMTLRVKKHNASWGTAWSVEFRKEERADPIFGRIAGGWYDSGCTYSECGLYRDGDTLYGYMPDLDEKPEEVKAEAIEVQKKLFAALSSAGAVVNDWNND